jgi:thioredoxin reductase (NADPH)
MSMTESFPTLDTVELGLLEPKGTRRQVEAGQYLYRSGDTGYDFYVVLSGQIEILLDADGDDRLITTHGPGKFLGELNLLTGLRVFLSARVTEDGEVLAIPVESFRAIIATQPQLSDKILTAFMARRADLITDAATATRVIGSRHSTETLQIREFLARTSLPHQWLDPDADPQVESLLEEFQIDLTDLPVVISSGAVLRRTTPGAVSEYLGLTLANVPERCVDLVIVGGGPAGLAAAVYGASEGLRTICLDRVAAGGQAGTSSRIENYFGFPTGISGSDLTKRGLVQAKKFGARLTAPCSVVALRGQAGSLILKLSDGTELVAGAVIAASGVHYRRIEVDRLFEFESSGVYYAATDLEARQCSGGPVIVVGGGNSAGQAAVFLAEQGSQVTVAIRGQDLNAGMSRYLVDRLDDHPHIEVLTQTQVVGLEGELSLRAVRLAGPGWERSLPVAGLFSFIGAEPTSGWLSGCAALDDRGFVLTDRSLVKSQLGRRWSSLGRRPLAFETSHPGLFAVGDLRSGSTKRVAAAVGEGSAAVRSVHDCLEFVSPKDSRTRKPHSRFVGESHAW